MKKLVVILNFTKILALTCIVAGSLSCGGNSGSNNSNEQSQTSDSLNKTQNGVANNPEAISNIAIIQVDSVVQNYDMYHDMKAEFEKKANKMQAEFSTKANAFQRDYADFQEKVEKGLMTRSQAEETDLKLRRRREDLEATGNKMQQELAEEEGVMLRKINDALMKYINKYNETKRYSLILNNAMVLYGVPSMDVTQEILKGINEEYIANKPASNSK
ncbi:MAG: OmpH family outer membrane protein [Prevotellaceae bacterium]|jgi:outer membrane protein|nr:OmpH family outer membrane protein [Prevotellaceae bacterium]